MSEPTVAPYGTWASPFTPELLSTGTTPVGSVMVSGSDVYWLEGRPTEGGRYVLVRRREGEEPRVLTPEGFNVRTRVHEYGGGAAFVHGSTVFFSNFSDQRLYRQDEGAEPVPVTPEPEVPAVQRYADGRVTPDGRFVICVRESHPSGELGDSAEHVTNDIVVIPADGSAPPRTLVSGADFYSFPRLDPSGERLVWTSWNHPNMPWDGTELWEAPVETASDGPHLGEARRVAGGPKESVFQPEWAPDGTLHFVSERSGWWNLYRRKGNRIEPVVEDDLEIGVAQWIFGLSTYAFLSSGRIACIWGRDGIQHLGLIDPGSESLLEIVTPFTWFFPTTLRSVEDERLAFVASGPRTPSQVCLLDPETGDMEVLRSSFEGDIDPGCISEARIYRFPSDGATAHAFFYPPTNSGFSAPEGELPPLLVISHGGPTGAAKPGLDLEIQYWTSRGFALVDVNYGGSTGFGRAYRERLRVRWGIVDVADCRNAARHLAEKGFVDGRRMAIRGGSAGGYTTLCALTFHDDFAAGASYFGVADVEALARDTHKFESRYLDGLIGPYPEARDTYVSRSPINFADRLSCPVILFQGLEDAIVPPSQAEEMVRALDAKGLPYAYLPFEGEQHGFRRAENIRRSLEAELSFYGQIFGFTPAGITEPVAIENLNPF
jgi:dipeptidyl aminopeptidase/acylaminoacyl peptidase